MLACLSVLMNPLFIMFSVIVKLLPVILVLLPIYFFPGCTTLLSYIIYLVFTLLFHVYGALCCDKPELFYNAFIFSISLVIKIKSYSIFVKLIFHDVHLLKELCYKVKMHFI